MRSKEQAHDYRYFPDPDLLPLKVDPEMFERVRAALPELPSQKKERFVSAMGIPAYDAGVLTASKPLADYFERAVELFPNPKAVSNWIMTELMRALKSGEDADPTHFPVSPEHLAELLALMHDGTISGRIAKTVFEEMIASGKSAAVVVKEKGLVQVSDESAIRELVCGILDKNPQELVKFLAGKEQVRGWFVGQAMKASKGKANPALLNKVLDEELARRASEQ
jgi:aspartyl-tRNA(Asn)/glutamyl-tRNA(Gln) amidotransferase subunit B